MVSLIMTKLQDRKRGQHSSQMCSVGSQWFSPWGVDQVEFLFRITRIIGACNSDNYTVWWRGRSGSQGLTEVMDISILENGTRLYLLQYLQCGWIG